MRENFKIRCSYILTVRSASNINGAKRTGTVSNTVVKMKELSQATVVAVVIVQLYWTFI